MSGQSPRVADVAPAFVRVTSHLTGSRWGGSCLRLGPEGWQDSPITAPPGSGRLWGRSIACESYSAPLCLCAASR